MIDISNLNEKGEDETLEINLWKQPRHTLRFIVVHPLEYVRNFFRAIKWAWQRSVRGYAEIDWWNMYEWMTRVLPDMFDTLAEKHFGYPGELAGFTDQQWTEFIHEIARHLRSASEEGCELTNEYADQFDAISEYQIDHMELHEDANGVTHHVFPELTDEQKAIQVKYFDREMEISRWREAEAAKAFEMIGKQFFQFWD